MSTMSTLTPPHSAHRAQPRNPEQGLHRPLDAPFRLQRWLVQPDLNQVRLPAQGVTRHLEPRLMLLLCYLAANPGRVMPREALIQALWPHVVVNENSLTRALSELRKQLRHPEGEACRSIQTIPKRGYRLDAAVSPNSTGMAVIPAPVLQRGPARWRLGTGVAAACLGLLVGLGMLTETGSSGPRWDSPLLADEVISSGNPILGRVSLSSTSALPDAAQVIEKPVVASDGKRFAYIKRDLAAYTLYLGEMDSETEPVALLTSQVRLSNLAWSPVGNALLFARHDTMTPAAVFDGEHEQAELLSLNLDNGRLRRLVEDSVSSGDEAPRVNLTALEPAWSHLLRTRIPPGLPG
ncbi:MAG: winged helix-turn-helix domain-containing protein [Pseudohongiellaceae bacterium]